MTSALCFSGLTSLMKLLTRRISSALCPIGGSSIVCRIVCCYKGSEVYKIEMSSSLSGCLECFAGLVSKLDEL